VLHQHKDEAKNGDGGEKANLEILTAIEKLVEVAIIFRKWRDKKQDSREQNEDATTHGTGLKGPVAGRSARDGCLLQLALSIFLDFTRFR
jgi:hypothetical protein